MIGDDGQAGEAWRVNLVSCSDLTEGKGGHPCCSPTYLLSLLYPNNIATYFLIYLPTHPKGKILLVWFGSSKWFRGVWGPSEENDLHLCPIYIRWPDTSIWIRRGKFHPSYTVMQHSYLLSKDNFPGKKMLFNFGSRRCRISRSFGLVSPGTSSRL